jgi:hypothetical protein
MYNDGDEKVLKAWWNQRQVVNFRIRTEMVDYYFDGKLVPKERMQKMETNISAPHEPASLGVRVDEIEENKKLAKLILQRDHSDFVYVILTDKEVKQFIEHDNESRTNY